MTTGTSPVTLYKAQFVILDSTFIANFQEDHKDRLINLG